MQRRLRILLLALPGLASVGPAQTQFAELPRNLDDLPPIFGATSSVAVGDVNGDGALDVVFGSFGQTRLVLNDPLRPGKFREVTATHLPRDSAASMDIALGDLDGDRDLDLILANAEPVPNQLYLNDGTGKFRDASTRLPVAKDLATSIALGDVDGDGDLDVLFGYGRNAGYSGQNRLYLNDGKANFTDVTVTHLPADSDGTFGVTFADVDGDRDLDIVCANSPTRNRLYLGDGKGRFADVTVGKLPLDNDRSLDVAAGDLDGDRDIDLVFAVSSGSNKIYLGDGRGKFTATAFRSRPGELTRTVALADVDEDGDVDLAFGNEGGSNRLFLGDGRGGFVDVTASQWPTPPADTRDVSFADVDADGDVDLVVATGSNGDDPRNKIFTNVERGRFRELTTFHFPRRDEATHAADLGDVDGDGDLDLVRCIAFPSIGGRTELFENDGKGRFRQAPGSLPADNAMSEAIRLVDIDRDGDIDVVLGRYWLQNRLYLNDGLGRFHDATLSWMPPDGDQTFALATGDVDGDGDLDLVCGNLGQNKLYLQQAFSFRDVTASHLPKDNDGSFACALGDVDGDGDLDLVFGNAAVFQAEGRNKLYLNDGKGRFSDVSVTHLPADSDGTFGLSFDDVDLDGDLDLAWANGGRARDPQQNRLYLNDGKGRFTDATTTRLPALLSWTNSVTFGDVDEDGDRDIVWGEMRNRNRVYLNDGKGKFEDATPSRLPDDPSGTESPLLGDVDGDGDLDLYLANIAGSCCPDRLYLNLRRQVSSPRAAQIGVLHALKFHLDAGFAQPGKVLVPFFHLIESRPPIEIPPFGRFGLAPNGFLIGQPLRVATRAGEASVRFTVPRSRDVVGVTLFTQALALHDRAASSWRLSNVNADRIVR